MSNGGHRPWRSLLEALEGSFAAAVRSPEGVADPAALLWTDADGQWRPVIAGLREAIPQLYTLGSLDPVNRIGPVIWLRCVVDRTLPGIAPAPGVIPILYLAGVSRQDLRAGGDCPFALQPLVELQYRGAVWHQRNGRDWTIDAFLTSDQGVGLDVSLDARTREAMLRALPILLTEPLDPLRGKRLDAEDFDRLSIGDPIRDLLAWMSSPDTFQGRSDAGRWETFRTVCAREFGFDPERDGPAAAGMALLHGGGKWDEVWQRFCEAPRVYAGTADLLREARPRDLLVDRARQPQVNESLEQQLGDGLEATSGLPHREACERILALESGHKERRKWVWAELGESPLAVALEPLARLAMLATSPLVGGSLESTAADYATDGWQCDRAALESLAAAKSPSETGLISRVVRALYEPWLDKTARHFQQLATEEGTELRRLVSGVPAESGTCILFADGLRFDAGGILQERLEALGLRVRMTHRISPLPTVTATAKPVVSPAYASCEAGSDATGFAPVLALSKQPVTASRLRDELARQGVEIVESDAKISGPQGDRGGWTELGRLDELGHSLGAMLVRQIDVEVETIADWVVNALNAGWTRVRIVTDHGWLLLPGGLPKVDLPAYLVTTKWARCATVRGESTPDIPTFAWHWDAHVRIASPPGIGSFIAGMEYAHGGVSLQECVVPELIVERGQAAVHAKISEVQWRGMRCRVAVDTNATGLSVELRKNWKKADPEPDRIAAPKALSHDGQASLVVEQDRYEGTAAMVVVLDSAGRALDHRPTTVGEQT